MTGFAHKTVPPPAARADSAAAAGDAILHTPNPGRQATTWSGPGADPAAARLRARLRRDPDYAPTPLIDRPAEARALGLGALHLKAENTRLAEAGLGSFKALGVMGALGALAPRPSRIVCASDGNFGRAVAWGAARLGIPATIYLPAAVSHARVDAIASFGAGTCRVAGGYDAAMEAAADAACAAGVVEFTDTGHDSVTEIPAAIQTSYGVIVDEVLEALGPAPPPTHVLVPTGVGGLTAGVIAAFDAALGPRAPDVIAVQPRATASLAASFAAGCLTGVPEQTGSPDAPPTLMVGLACETPSSTAWPILSARLAHALAVPDAVAVDGLRALAQGTDGPVIAGESGAAAHGALLAAASDRRLRAALGLSGSSRVLVLVTETATDPEIHARLIAAAPFPAKPDPFRRSDPDDP
ncbi:MAG: pyridoxal-phosphate dependent enzyme [Roseicyclus sp.]